MNSALLLESALQFARRGSQSNYSAFRTSNRKELNMAYYLFQAAYTSEAWATLLKKPQNRFEVVRAAIEKLGGSLEGGWFAFGEYDLVLIAQFPDNSKSAAFALATAAGGALKSAKTTPLMTFDEGLEAMKHASKTGYRPPK